jgi:hypothetical protein
MKKSFQNILKAAFVISTIGLIMDSDVKEASMLFRFFEFSMMTVSIFVVLSVAYFSFTLSKRYFLSTRKI